MEADQEFHSSATTIDISKYYTKPYEVKRSKIIEGLIPPGEKKLAIDIGCGAGYFSRILANKGWRTTALDTDPGNVQSAENYASEILMGDATRILSELPKDRYDFALALEIIEHMPKAHGEALLKAIRRVLKPGGLLLISTPNRFSPEGLGGYYWGERIRRCGKWKAWDSTHVHIYSSWEIVRLLRQCGLTATGITGYWYEGRLPLIGRWRMPFVSSGRFPFNRLGFNLIAECRKN
jgi:2-polyprenyl-3-methyl-5-hydroxy-6-metoxy-1,4-benzoquinol methylase